MLVLDSTMYRHGNYFRTDRAPCGVKALVRKKDRYEQRRNGRAERQELEARSLRLEEFAKLAARKAPLFEDETP